MGSGATDLTHYGKYVFAFAVAFMLFGFFVLFVKPLIGNRLSRSERSVLWSFNIVVYWLLVGVIAMFGLQWYADLRTNDRRYSGIVESLGTHAEREPLLGDLRTLLEICDRRLSIEDSEVLKTIHKRESLTQFAEDLVEPTDSLISILNNETFARTIAKYDEPFLAVTADRARVAYETRNILGYAETITIASVGVFLPLLILMWNSSKDAVSNSLHGLISLRNKSLVPNETLEESIRLVHDDLKQLFQIGKELRPYFFVTIGAICVFLVVLASANFTSWKPLEAYVLAVALKALAIILFLWFVICFSIYQGFVQPLVRGTSKHLHVFGLEDL